VENGKTSNIYFWFCRKPIYISFKKQKISKKISGHPAQINGDFSQVNFTKLAAFSPILK